MQPPNQRDDYLPERAFPVEATETASPTRAAPRPSGRGLSRYVLPIVLFVGIVAVTAWVTQFMPSWRGRATNEPNPAQDPRSVPVLRFARIDAVWDKDDKDFVRPFEKGTPGHYDFPFRNIAGEEVQLGLERVGCDCANIEVALLPTTEWDKVEQLLRDDPGSQAAVEKEPTWQPLKVNADEGISVPADGHGLIRVNWKSRKEAGESLNLGSSLWAQPAGDRTRRGTVKLKVPTYTAAPYFLEPDKVGVGILSKRDVGKAEFKLFSVTRPEVNLKVEHREASPFLHVVTRPLTADEIKGLKEALANTNSRQVQSGIHLTVTVHEQKDGKEMDLGPFMHRLTVLVDELPSDGARPVVYGRVKADDVEVGGAEEQGRVALGTFRTRDGTRQNIPVWTDVKSTLEQDGQQPATLEVKVRKDDKQLTSGKTKWLLELTVPPDVISGPLPEHSAITLRLVGPTARLVRIPLSGNAVSD